MPDKEIRIATAKSVAEYWMEMCKDSNTIQAFGRVFVDALNGETDYSKLGVPDSELGQRVRRHMRDPDGFRSPPTR